MFAYFCLLSLEADSEVVVAEPKDKNACFNLIYDTGNHKNTLTSDEKGFFVGYRTYDANNKQSDIHLVKWSEKNVSKSDNIQVKFGYWFQKNSHYTLIYFNVTNLGYFSKKVDLGIFGDIYFYRGGDNVTVSKYEGRGFYVQGGNQHSLFQLENEGIFPPVSTLFIGEMNNDSTSDPYNFEYFKNETILNTTGDSVVAFSWMNKVIQGGETLRLGFLVKQGSVKQSKGYLVDRTEKKEFYKPGEKATIKFRMHDFDQKNFSINVALENGTKATYQFEFKNGSAYNDFEFDVTFNQTGKYTYNISAPRDSINDIRGFFAVRYDRPSFEVSYPPKSWYKDGALISVQANGKECRRYKYTFGDNARVFFDNDAWYFIDYPDELRKGQTVTLKLWCEADDRVASNISTYQIKYGNPEDNNKPPQTDPSGQGSKPTTPKGGKNGPNVLAIVLPIVFAVLIIAAAIVAVIIYNKKKNPSPKDDTEVPVTDGGAGKYQNFE